MRWNSARAGADLIVNDRPGSPDLAQTAKEIVELGRTCIAIEADAFSRVRERLVSQAAAACGRIDILVSNPAASSRAKFLEYDPVELEHHRCGDADRGLSHGSACGPVDGGQRRRREDRLHLQHTRGVHPTLWRSPTTPPKQG